MQNKWSDTELLELIAAYGGRFEEDLIVRTYSSRLIGAEKELVLHGGGNSSVKTAMPNVLGKRANAVCVKASGADLASIDPRGHTAMDLDYLRWLRDLGELTDEAMVNELNTHRFDANAPTASIEALMHSFIPAKYVDHTHADAILALGNRPDGASVVRQALGNDVIVLDYVKPGFALAKAAADAFESFPHAEGMVLLKHGLVTWGAEARESYDKTVSLVTKAEEYLAREGREPLAAGITTGPDEAKKRYVKIAAMVRGLLAVESGDADRPYRNFILCSLIDEQTLAFIDSKEGKAIALTPPLTADHLIRTKPLPLWIDDPYYEDDGRLREQLSTAIAEYAHRYEAYVDRQAGRMTAGLKRFDSKPRVIFMPGLGAICAGKDSVAADIARDITVQTIKVKSRIAGASMYEGLSEGQLFDMEYYSLQHAKLERAVEHPLSRSIALVTGAAGAIGAGICEELLKNGCHVAATDLPGDHLDGMREELAKTYAGKIIAVPVDVTDPSSVAAGFERVVTEWGGIDLVIANAGLAHVSSIADMDMSAFRNLHKVNVEGTVNVLKQAASYFKMQGTGGDVVLVSTKNVFAPGANFAAYSATKAAAHQIARIAGLEMAELGVRVNMVSPDAVFSHGDRKSGLWAEVGPDRMRARGLDEEGLEEYYRNRNLLKVKVTAVHVARAVLFFATRQTPTTGATIPVDGGLPDATPR
jgi:rhamnose utilization protein RhaD (predicted bifunctional aldolase and dehydrogenase)/NAD(P)-dependent dehydrogenase (short-subunit alcohol dehydrogenase family)